MIFRPVAHFVLGLLVIGSIFSVSLSGAEEKVDVDFKSLLELADLGPVELAKFSRGPDYSKEDWQLLVKLLYRLEQNSAKQIERWAKPWNIENEPEVGGLYEVVGKVVSVEILTLPKVFSQLHNQSKLFRCQVSTEASGAEFVVLTTRIPSGWASRDVSVGEPVQFHGILLQLAEGVEQLAAVMLTDRLAWYPVNRVSSGMALLARQGMDIAMLDEVVHRKPFVKPSVSREGEAFYACLAAVASANPKELGILAKQNVAVVAEKWSKLREPLAKQYQLLKKEASAANEKSKKLPLAKQVKAAGQRLALADAVLERSKAGTSSVAPLFLQPQQEVGELVRLEGVARRAIRIAEIDEENIEAYYELEIFPPDSQDLPVVCCATQLPAGFPLGDEIREPVLISGVFFKSWQYRARKLAGLARTDGETKRQQQLYTPIVIASTPIWLQDANVGSPWGFWGGIAFLVILLMLWLSVVRGGQQEQRVRKISRQSEVFEMPLPAQSEEDLPEIKT